MTALRRTLLIVSSLFVLLSCTPAFETTAQLCEASLPLTLPVPNYQTLANRDSNDYKLYLEDILNSFQNIQTKAVAGVEITPRALDSDEQAIVDFIFSKADEYMGYTMKDGVVDSSSNPLDFMESIIAATDKDEIIQTFVEAKQHLAEAISKDDGICSYRNSNIRVNQEDSDLNILSYLDATFALRYVPSEFEPTSVNTIDQTLFFTLVTPDPEDSESTSQISFSGSDVI